jgi:hypothetical protein
LRRRRSGTPARARRTPSPASHTDRRALVAGGCGIQARNLADGLHDQHPGWLPLSTGREDGRETGVGPVGVPIRPLERTGPRRSCKARTMRPAGCCWTTMGRKRSAEQCRLLGSPIRQANVRDGGALLTDGSGAGSGLSAFGCGRVYSCHSAADPTVVDQRGFPAPPNLPFESYPDFGLNGAIVRRSALKKDCAASRLRAAAELDKGLRGTTSSNRLSHAQSRFGTRLHGHCCTICMP